MTLQDVVIDERTWSEASEPRRQEWQATIRELLESDALVIRDDAHRLRVTVSEQGTRLEMQGDDESVLSSVSIPREALAEHITEYVDVVREIAKDEGTGGASRLEALDMAKKVAHDRGGRVIRRYCRDFGMDLRTARKLFTLVLSLRVDTTRLVGIHGHRRVK